VADMQRLSITEAETSRRNMRKNENTLCDKHPFKKTKTHTHKNQTKTHTQKPNKNTHTHTQKSHILSKICWNLIKVRTPVAFN